MKLPPGAPTPVPLPPEITFRPLTRADALDAGKMFATAFADNPANVAQFPDPVKRERAMINLFRAKTIDSVGADGALGAFDGAKLVGAMLAFPPGTYPVKWTSMLRSAPYYAAALVQGGLSNIPGVLRSMSAYKYEHPDAYYVADLGVDPKYQGLGLGLQFAIDLIPKIDKMNVPVFVETSNPVNVKRYEKIGFETIGKRDVDATKPYELWQMLRPAQNLASDV